MKSRRALLVAAAAVGWLAGPSASGQDDPDSPATVQWSEPARLVKQSLLLDVEGHQQRRIVVGERGHILVSRDGGAEWEQVRAPTRSNLTAVEIVDDAHAWAVGHDAVILHSPDGGATWVRQHWAPELEQPLFDVWMEDAERGFAVGAYGLYLETEDGGASWRRREFDPDEPHLYLVDQADDGRLYLVGEFGSIYTSENRGRDWSPCESPYGGSFFGVVTAGTDVLVFGLRGNVYRSADQGETWSRVDTGITTGLFAGATLPDGRLLIVGQSGTVLVSADQGRSFDARNAGNRNALSAVYPQPDGSLLLVGEGGIRTLPGVPEAAR